MLFLILRTTQVVFYLSFEWITAQGVHTLIGDHIEECIVHIATLTTMVTIGN